jgi:hypothetical protein
MSVVIQTSFVVACIAPNEARIAPNEACIAAKCASVFKQTLEQGRLLQLVPHVGARVQKTRHFARHQRSNVVGQGTIPCRARCSRYCVSASHW